MKHTSLIAAASLIAFLASLSFGLATTTEDVLPKQTDEPRHGRQAPGPHPIPGWHYYLVYDQDSGRVRSGVSFDRELTNSHLANLSLLANTAVIEIEGDVFVTMWSSVDAPAPYYVDVVTREVKDRTAP